ncbi:MAG TPA: BlaI/MecI/CopY family transcriptional regulator, partial [Streptosporangiaceae bacterium]|nr:BlaI/MecI/CopY family transcriptional regulator [Streptosporangiaceae bacterium]
MARFGDLEASIMDVVWATEAPVRVREVSDQLNRERPLAFNTVQTVMENLFHKGWLTRHKKGRAYWYQAARSRDDYVPQLLDEALSVAPDP